MWNGEPFSLPENISSSNFLEWFFIIVVDTINTNIVKINKNPDSIKPRKGFETLVIMDKK